MDSFTKGLKFFIVALNFILLFGSIVLLVFGILFHTGANLDFIEALETKTKDNIRDLITTTGIGDVNNIDRFSFTQLLGGWLAHSMIGVALCMFVLSFSGCCGAWYKVRLLLLIYIIVLSVIMFVEVLIIVLMFTVPITIQGQIKREMDFTIADFQGLAGNNGRTLGWMFIMDYYKCCGTETYKDFQNEATVWDRTPGSIVTRIDAPLICCKSIPTGGADNDVNCAREASKDIYTEGCFDVIWNKVLESSLYTYVVIGNVFLLQILLLLSSIKFYGDAKEKRKVKPFKPILKKTKNNYGS